MLDEIKGRLEGEISRLKRELNIDLPKRIEAALELGDLRENSEYKAAKERQAFVEARLGQLSSRVSGLAKINLDEMELDRVAIGSEVKVLDFASGQEFTFTITPGDFIDLDAGQVSMASPIGQALMGSSEGDEVDVRLPGGVRRYRVEKLTALGG
ncbi:MAG: GreA/GreB family elongation factor [Gemmatimonadetes bacterium]|nr:GreA/GreB family elongation factor [Gemmatimonadota bacterium]